MNSTQPKRILVVDDESDVTDLICYHLRAKGFQATALNEADRALAVTRSLRPDLIVLDVMMPGLTGFQICRLLRADPDFKALPIIFLTARTEESDRIQGFESGGDDYVQKPFSPKELVLRIESMLRRSTAAPSAPSRLRIGDILMETERHAVSVRGEPLDLTATEFKLLRILMERQGRVQSREHLLIHVWQYETGIETRTVDTHVRRLREKLGPEAAWIETVRGVGYRMAERRPLRVGP